MSSRPDLEVESKKEFLASINLGFKPEYEFGTGIDCYEFITKELGVTENEIPSQKTNILMTQEKRNSKCVSNTVLNGTINLENADKIHKNISHFKETEKSILDSFIQGGNLTNIEIIFDSEENEEILKKYEIDARRYPCYICYKSFSNKFRRRKHLGIHLKKHQPKLTMCPFCGKTFTNRNELSQHFTTHLTKSCDQKMNRKCKLCFKIFSRATNLKRHLNTVHSKEKENAIFRCELCLKILHTRYHFEKHMLTHNNQQEYHCYVCKKSFKRKYHLNRHLSSHQGTENHFNNKNNSSN